MRVLALFFVALAGLAHGKSPSNRKRKADPAVQSPTSVSEIHDPTNPTIIVLEAMRENFLVTVNELVERLGHRLPHLPRSDLLPTVLAVRKDVLRPLVQPVWFHALLFSLVDSLPQSDVSLLTDRMRAQIPPSEVEYLNGQFLASNIAIWIRFCIEPLMELRKTSVLEQTELPCFRVARTMPDLSVERRYVVNRAVAYAYFGDRIWEEKVNMFMNS